MQYRNRIVLVFTILLALAVAACRGREGNGAASQPATSTDSIHSIAELDIADFQAGSGRAVAIMGAGMTIADDADSADFTTDVISSTHPFNYVVPQWTAQIPPGSDVEFMLRTAELDGDWGEWQTIVLDPDTSDVELGEYAGSFADSGNALGLHDRVQVNVKFRPNTSGESPVINSMALTFIDSTNGPTTQEILRDIRSNEGERKLSNQAGAGYPKPRIITRDQWCTRSECNYSNGLSYYPVSHLIVHHTVSNNSTTDWAANVRAIWTFHTFTRGWGDVGYNYLIDPNGNIYEGHIGGDNVIGTHAAAANRGSMGVALLGTFSTTNPPPAMKAALVELLAWKADERNIDLWDASRLPLLDWGNLHLMGHRDAFGQTECPGGLAHHDLTEVRQQVDQKLGRTEDFFYVDDRDGNFTVSNANWYDGPKQCGFNAHSFYTFSTDSQAASTNVGEWKPIITADGKYQVDAYVPFCATGRDDSRQAAYTVFDGQGGQQRIVRDQENNLGMWVSLGEHNFRQGGNVVVRLQDLTTSESNKPIWFDAIRYKRIDGYAEPPPVVNPPQPTTVPPPPPVVGDTTPPTSRVTEVHKQCNGDFTLFWEGSDNDSGVKHYDISYKRPFDSNWTTVLNDTRLTSFTFTPPDQTNDYRFRAQAVDNNGNVEPFKDNGDIGSADAVPCNIDPPVNNTPPDDGWAAREATFSWSLAVAQAAKSYELEVATDPGFGNVVVRKQLAGDQQQATYQFDRDYDKLYWRVSAETHQNKRFTSNATAFAIDSAAPESKVYEAYQLANGDYKLFWEGSDSASGVAAYTVEYLGGGSDWTPIVENTQQTTAVFRPPDTQQVYLFRALARDNAGNVATASQAGDFDSSLACPYINTPPQHLTPTAESWRSNRAVVFRWGIENVEPRCTTQSTIVVAADADFNNVLDTRTFDDAGASARGAYVYTADEGLDQLWWRATHITVLGETYTSEPTRVRFDTTAPDTRVVAVQSSDSRYLVRAEGSDSEAGIVGYIFEYQREGDSRWIRWSVGDSNVAFLNVTDANAVYKFRSLGIDAAGNIEPPNSDGDMNSSQATPLRTLFLPLVHR